MLTFMCKKSVLQHIIRSHQGPHIMWSWLAWYVVTNNLLAKLFILDYIMTFNTTLLMHNYLYFTQYGYTTCFDHNFWSSSGITWTHCKWSTTLDTIWIHIHNRMHSIKFKLFIFKIFLEVWNTKPYPIQYSLSNLTFYYLLILIYIFIYVNLWLKLNCTSWDLIEL
jgi:hypothetical protein